MPAWLCPYCNQHATITASNASTGSIYFNDGSKDGDQAIFVRTITCPNRECRDYEIKASLYRCDSRGNLNGEARLEWPLKPTSTARSFPDYIPEPILEDYAEACAIRDLSPKASATLSRRCLQGIIRDFHGVSKDRLFDEINEIKDRIDSSTWKAIDAVRKIGNIGAHMEKDINLVIDVDPQEAQLLIRLIETLLKDWYVGRHEREAHLDAIVKMAVVKEAEKKKT